MTINHNVEVICRSAFPLIGALFIVVIIFGDCLVAQPSFIFGSVTANSMYKETYAEGAVITLVVAFGSGCYRVLQATSGRVPTAHFMFMGGLALFLVGFLCPVFNLPTDLHKWEFIRDNYPILLMISVCSWMSALLLLLAVKITGRILDAKKYAANLSLLQLCFTFTESPVLVSVVRTTEIMMSLILDSALCGMHSYGWLYGVKILGSCIVMSQIICIAFLDKIQGKVDDVCSRKKEYTQPETKNKLEEVKPSVQ